MPVLINSILDPFCPVALALTKLGSAGTRHIAAWVNIVGALQGTPLADTHALPEIENKLGQVNLAGVDSLTTKRSRERFETLRIPAHVLVVNYLGIPLTGSLSSWSRPGFSHLRNFGPNDGFLLLSDMIFPSGVTLAQLGRDHFLLDERDDATTVAFAITVMRWQESQNQKISQIPGR